MWMMSEPTCISPCSPVTVRPPPTDRAHQLASNYWHLIALTYSATNTALFLDGVLATNGPGITSWPGTNVLAGGFFIGSDSNGVIQAQGAFDDLYTYNVPLDTNTVYYGNTGCFGRYSSSVELDGQHSFRPIYPSTKSHPPLLRSAGRDTPPVSTLTRIASPTVPFG